MNFTIVIFFGISNSAFWFDLLEHVVSKFQSYYEHDYSDENFSSVYSSKFSKDPFGDAMSNVEWRSIELKISWSQYIEEVLNQKWCNLSKKEIWGILYYFVPEFRTELARSLKQEYGDYKSSKYVFTGGQIAQYCGKYYLCEKSIEMDNDYPSFECEAQKESYDTCKSNCKKSSFIPCCENERKEYVNCVNEWKWSKITSSDPNDVMSSCSEFFKKNYKNGQDNKEVLQQVEVAQIWADKYWNGTTDDSPYDIMSDLWVLAKLLYYGAEEPITPVIYNIPMFSNSKKNLAEKKSGGSSSDGVSSDGWGQLIVRPVVEGWWKIYSDDSWEWVSLLWWDKDQNQVLNVDWWSLDAVKGLPLSYNIDWYDDLVDWLNSLSLVNEGSDFYSSLCKNEDDVESEPEAPVENKWLNNGDNRDFSELSDEEYQEIIDYMLDAVDDYSKLPEDKEKEIQENMWDVDDIFDAMTFEDLEEAEKQIKNCWKSCEGLRIDQKASCMLKCACWERSSAKINLFDSNKTPWLWPIFLIRFCAVPAVNTNFSVGWKRIHSIEEWLNEIYWVVDKLSREWKLWKWTQQYEFLDSSTKKINIADTLAFSIDVDFVDITNKKSTHSDQYEEKSLNDFNQRALEVYGISNPLDNPSAKNVYRIDREWDDWWLKTMVDLIDDSKANRYSMNEESMEKWMKQQGNLWERIYEDFSDWITYSEKLYTKRS